MRVRPASVPVFVATLLTAPLHAAEPPARATLLEATAGDIACYLSLRLPDGEQVEQMADFALCEAPPPRGRELHWEYRSERVAAASCEGDPECTDSESVALAVAWRDPAAAAGLCASDQQTVFSCRSGSKQVAVCASDRAPRLQYRFGRGPQALEKLLPAGADEAVAISGATLAYSGGGGAWLRFRSGDHAYVLYTGIGRWGAQGETEERSGVAVERKSVMIANLRCAPEAQSELGPDWFEAQGIGAGDDEEFELPVD